MFKPCVIVPVYNHKDKIGQIVASVNAQELPCILVDDGSDCRYRYFLEELSANNTSVELIRLEPNQGKGAAVCTGLQFAAGKGFTHALQIDADGQHDPGDISKFISTAKNNTKTIVSGARSYAEMPNNRKYGRMITDFWVCVNTLSTQIKDSMCGYRVYPLAQTCELLAKQKVCSRMDFDSDIIVRLYWAGVPVINVYTKVRYDESIPSHFDLWNDNIRISKMHARLFFGMLTQLHRILKLKFKPSA